MTGDKGSEQQVRQPESETGEESKEKPAKKAATFSTGPSLIQALPALILTQKCSPSISSSADLLILRPFNLSPLQILLTISPLLLLLLTPFD
eukprot:m.42513 g.42513  ORF g.42513 m.42513 type:complete len:92 (+) comp11934_c0_seq1:628-903(+)